MFLCWAKARSAVILAAACCLLPGCARGPRYHRVTGQVKVDGEPVDNVQITFLPEDATSKTASGITFGGQFEMLSGIRGRRGVLEGRYSVVFVQLEGGSEPIDYDASVRDPARRGGADGRRAEASDSSSQLPTDEELELPPGMPQPPFALQYCFPDTTPEAVEISDELDVVFNLSSALVEPPPAED